MLFEDSLNFGRLGEGHIAKWLISRGHTILPVYEIEIPAGKGPRLFTPKGNLIAPDMVVLKNKEIIWIEAKHKNAFTWHRKTNQWVTGIDLKHYQDYCEIAKRFPYDIWLLFLHCGGMAKDSPPDSPSGLFGNSLKYLINNENHRHENWGNKGMVYWSINNLKYLASYPLR